MNNFFTNPKYSSIKMVGVLFFFITIGIFALNGLSQRDTTTTAQVLNQTASPVQNSFSIGGLVNQQVASGVVAVSANNLPASVVSVQVSIDGNPYVTIAQAPFNTNIDTKQFSQGSHTISMQANTSSGTYATESLVINVAN